MLTCIPCCYCVFHCKRDPALRASRMFLVSGAPFAEPTLQDRQGAQKVLLQLVWKCRVSMGRFTELISEVPVVSPSPGWHGHQQELMVPQDSNNGTTASRCVGSSLSWGRSSIIPSYLFRYRFQIFFPFLTFLQLYRLPSCPTRTNRLPSVKDSSCRSGKAALGKNNVYF